MVSVARASWSELFAPGVIVNGRWVLERQLSSGGMGSVWVAHDQVLDIDVALKLVREDMLDAVLMERLEREAQLAARIEHPATVRVLGFDRTDNGVPFIVMELLEGEDLRTLLDRVFRFSPVEAVQLLLPIASAMLAVHSKGVLHRDLKPENVFVARIHGRVQPKLVDFGVAMPLRARRRLTLDGAVVGSPEYLAPEQALGRRDVDERADVWGLCAVLYECVTGFTPFARSRTDELLTDVVAKPVRPFHELAIEDRELWAIVERGLSKQPEDRWPDMRALGKALARWLVDRGVGDDVCGRSLRAEWLGMHSVPHPVVPTPFPKPLPERAPARPHRLLFAAAAALCSLLVAAAAPAASMFSTSVSRLESIAHRVEVPTIERKLPPVRDVPVEVAPEPKPEPKLDPAPKAAAKPKRLPPGFDPVLGF